MKSINLYNFILTGLFLIFSSVFVVAQEPLQPQGAGMNQNGPPSRPNLLSELNLSQPQMRQIRRINQERKPIMQESQRRLHDANRALDEAIYSDSSNETEIQERLKEAQEAQMEVIKNRTMTELAIRRVLTPEQLMKFRQLRSQFLERNEPENRMNPRQDKLRNLPKGLRPNRPPNRLPDRPIQ